MKKKSYKLLSIFVMFVTVMHFVIPASLALFRTEATTTGSIKTAKWSVGLDQEGVNNELTVVNDGEDDDTFLLTVKSNSEVDVVYSITISNIPAGVQVKLDDADDFEPESTTVTFENAGTIAYTGTEQTATHVLKFKALTTASPVENKQIKIDVVMRQAL